MQRPFVLASVLSLLGAAAAAAQVVPTTPPMIVVAQPPVMQADLGGGFIEFLFNGGPPRQPAPPPQAYANALPGYVAVPPGYAPQQVSPDGVDPRYLRQEVDYRGKEEAGTIVIDTPDKFLYLVEPGGKALRYGIGVGRPGFTWAGVHKVSSKKEWPDWVPPAEMLQRQPGLPHFMAGGPSNPLGARAIYLGSTLYRIHGSNEPWTIGQQVSSGCIRLRNEDVIDLYGRVKVGATVVVL